MNFQALGAVAKFKRNSATAEKVSRSGSLARKSFSLLAKQVKI